MALAHTIESKAERAYRRGRALDKRRALMTAWCLFASAFTRDPRKRLKLATDLFRSFPFGSPSYKWRDVPSTDGAIAFDCLKCPVAEFFASHNSSELCVQTFCQLDFPLAETWGGQLERSGTIASGAELCDFRWYPLQTVDGALK